jgi:hypothetical protein
MPWNKDGTRKKSAYKKKSSPSKWGGVMGASSGIARAVTGKPFKPSGIYGAISGGTWGERDWSNDPRGIYGSSGSSFQMRSSNTTPFKQMGSSPLKQDYVKDRYHKKYNPTGTKGKTTTKTPKPYEFKTSTKTVPKIKDVTGKTLTNVILKGDTLPAEKIAAKTVKKKAIKKTLTKTILKGAGKLASKFLGPIGTALTAIEVGKTAKEAIPSLKERARSGNVNIGRKI